MNSKYLKKLFAVLLLGFIFAFNAIPVSFAQQTSYISSCYPGDNCPTGCSFISSGIIIVNGTSQRCSDGYVACKCSSEIVTPPPVNPGAQCDKTDAQISAEINSMKCSNGGSAIWDRLNCKATCSCPTPTTDKPTCPTNQEAIWNADTCEYVCNPIFTQLPQDADLRAVISPYQLKVTIPCNPTALGTNIGKCTVADNPAGYIARLYQFSLMIVGFVALGAIIYGAALYTLSAGNMTSKEEGKSWMLNAIYGILLLLGAYLILYTINPNLVNLANPSMEKIDLDSFLPPPTQVTDCSQIKPDYSNISQPCGANCKLDATTANGCSSNGSNNNVSENSGASAIPGCLVSQSSGGMFGINTTNNGKEISSLSSSKGSMECTKCAEGNDLVNGTCVCKTNLVRQPDGTCGSSKTKNASPN
jgi:hypothetical protein